jgi:hypothetical protein
MVLLVWLAMFRLSTLLALVLLTACAGSEPSALQTQAHDGKLEVAGLHWVVPSTWERFPDAPRVWASYRRPAVDPETHSAKLTVYYSPGDAGGAIEKTLRYWVSEMEAPDGSDANRIALRSRLVVEGANYDFVAVDGIYQESMGGGPMTGGRTKAQPGHRLVGTVVEGPGGRAFLRLIGPAATARQMEAEMRAMFGLDAATDSVGFGS